MRFNSSPGFPAVSWSGGWIELNDGFKIGSTLKAIIVNTGWLAVLRVLRIFFALFVGVWIARYLGPERFGLYNYAIAFVALFVPVAGLGLQSIVVRDLVKDPDGKEEILGSTFYLRLISGIVCILIVTGVVTLMHPGDTYTLLLVVIIAVTMVFQAFDSIDLWFQSRVQSKYTVYAKGLALILTNIFKIVLILNAAPLVAFVAVAAIDSVFGAIGMVAVYRMNGFSVRAWRMSVTRARELLSESWPLMLSGTLIIVYLKIDQVMLGRMLGLAAVGIYSTAVRISEVWYFVPVIITTSVFPALIRSKGHGKDVYYGRLQQLFDLLAGLALALAFAMTFAARPLMHVLYGERFAGAGQILVIHIWAGLFVFVKAALNSWSINEGHVKFVFASNLVGAVVNVVMNLFLIPVYGGVGAAVATVVSYGAAGYLICFFYRKSLGMARMITLAFIVPVRAVAWLAAGRGRGSSG